MIFKNYYQQQLLSPLLFWLVSFKESPCFSVLLVTAGEGPWLFFSINFFVIVSIASVILNEFLALVSIISIPVCFFKKFLSSSVTCFSFERSHLFPTINFIGLLSVYLFISSNQSLMCPKVFLSVTSYTIIIPCAPL